MTYVPVARQGGCGPGGCVGGLLVLTIVFVAVAILSIVIIGLVVIGWAIYMIIRWLTTPQPRMFGAWPMSRWTNAYEHGLFLLEDRTGVDVNSSPMRILMGTLTLSLPPLIVLSWLLSAFSPALLWILPGVGLAMGFGTALVLSRTPDLFWPRTSSASISLITKDEDGLPLLMQDDW